MDGLWRLVLLCAVDADNFFLSAAEERAVATRPAPTTDFCALALFLVGIVEWEENWLSYFAVDDCCDVGFVITEFMSVVGVIV